MSAATMHRLTCFSLNVILVCLLQFVQFSGCNNETVIVPTATIGKDKQKMILIMLDGFRWDYPSRDGLKGFPKIKEKGVVAEYLAPVFPSMSYPNYQSLVTGLYAENHGVVMNHMYDEARRTYFWPLPSESSNKSYWWDEAEPVWISARKAGLKTFLYLWPGCEVSFNNTLPTFCEPYKSLSGLNVFRKHLDLALDKIANDTADFVQIYCEHADQIGHSYGPESEKMATAIKDIDDEMFRFVNQLEALKLEDKVNVIVVSDHGMTQTDDKSVKRVSFEHAFYGKNIVDFVIGFGAVVGIFPLKPNIVKETLEKFEGINVWHKEEIPDEYHIKNSFHTPPIFVLAKKGYFVTPMMKDKQIPTVAPGTVYNGFHGYDVNEVPDMRGIFYAYGPGFENKMEMPPIKNVDVYNVMTHLLDIDAHPNNGTWSTVFKYLTESKNSASPLWNKNVLWNAIYFSVCIYMFIFMIVVEIEIL